MSSLRTALALGFLVVSAAGLSSACSGETKVTPKECVGGVINPDTGKCEGKCTPDKCVADNTCSDNRCVLKCASHQDCYHDGTQDCAPAMEDDTDAPIQACLSNGKAYGVGFGCAFGNECQAFGACPSGASCNRAMCGGQPDTCMKDAAACGNDESCTVGKCAGEGSPCTVNPCSAAECTSLFCVSSGVGDADAYCTQSACATDDDCAGGYYCGLAHDPHSICNANPAKGDNEFCGKTDEPCIDPSTFGQGNTLMEGSVCLLRKVCLKRAQCAPCATDLDCSQVASQLCVDVGGSKHCARTCNVDKDCDPDSMCDAGACKPRFGSCVGNGGFCEPCLNDEDCGSNGTRKVCYEVHNQRACVDLASGACTSDADCPKSPGNMLNGLCATDGVCLPPLFQDTLTCW